MEVVSEVKMAENISLKQLDQGSMKLLDDQLTCSICLDRFKDPRLLPCHHYFCKECIDKIVEFRLDELESNNEDQMSILCPECRRKYNINCVESLVPAFFINRFESIIKAIERSQKNLSPELCGLCSRKNNKGAIFCKMCDCSICLFCQEAHEQMRTFQTHQLVKFNTETIPECIEHQEPLKYFCQTCTKLLCGDCIMSGHRDHECGLLQSLGKNCSIRLQARVDQLSHLSKQILEAQARMEEKERMIKDDKTKIRAEVEKSCDLLHHTVDQLKELVDFKVDEIFNTKQEVLRRQQRLLCVANKEISLVTSTVSLSVNQMSTADMVLSADMLLKQYHEVMDKYKSLPQTWPSWLDTPVIIDLPSTQELKSLLGNRCMVYDTSADPEKCSFVGLSGLVQVGDKLELCIGTARNDGTLCSEIQKVVVTYHCLNQGTGTTLSVENRSIGKYHFVLNPLHRGNSEIRIEVNDKQILGSPFLFQACMPVMNMHKPVNIIHCVKCPWGVTCVPTGALLIVESSASIAKFTPTTKRSLVEVEYRITREELSCPCGIAVDEHENMYVTDAGNHRLYKFNKDGDLLQIAGEQGNLPAQLIDPMGVAYSQKRIFLCDSGNHCVKVFKTQDLQFLWKFGKEGGTLGHFLNPTDISISENNTLYVTDLGNSRVQVFTVDGIHLFSFGNEVLIKPAAIDIDSDRMVVFVTDLQALCLFVFNYEGKYLTRIGETCEMNSPLGVVCDNNGYVYVCDHYGNCLVVF